MTDAELLASFVRDRSEDALRELLGRHSGLVYAAALRQVRDPGAAEDITQGVFVALAQKAASLQTRKTPLCAWLLAATRYGAINVLRRRAARTYHEQKAAVMQTQSSSGINSDLLNQILDDVLNRLAESDRTAVALYYLENRTLREVGDALCISERAAQKRVSRALARLCDVLTRRGITAPAEVLETNLRHCGLAAAPVTVVASVMNSVLHSASTSSVASTIAQEILRSLHMKTLRAFALTTTIVALVAAPAAPFVYHALSVSHATVSVAADSPGAASVESPTPALTDYIVVIDGKIDYPSASVQGQKLRNQKTPDGHTHAILIMDSNSIDLNPAGFTDSWVSGNNGTQQIGYGKTADGAQHALLWLGNPQSAVDLNPNGFTASQGWGVADNQAVGSGTTTGGAVHALLWTGAASSFVDLNPRGFAQSWAIATNGSQQVGLGMTTANPMPHALIWNGTAKSAVDLQQFLPAGYTMSKAFAVTDSGKIIGQATDNSYRNHIVEWIPSE